MEQVYWYCLAYAAKLHGVLVHAACLMSTHAHEVITDVRGNYPLFLQTLHRNLALCTKAYRGWPAEVFDKRSTSVHALLTPEATIESIAYLIANPVEALAVTSNSGRRNSWILNGCVVTAPESPLPPTAVSRK